MKSTILVVFLVCIKNVFSFTCPAPSGFYPDPTDCSKFYICNNGQATQVSCGAGTVFNPQSKVCDWPSNVNCGGSQTTTPSTTTQTNTNPGNAIMSQAEFSNTVTSSGYPTPSTAKYTAFINGLSIGGITTKQEACMLLANVIHETGGLQIIRESCAPCAGSYPCQGTCTNCPPGQYYHGRGYIQLSWCYNYRDASQALYHDDRLLTNPDQVANDENIAWATAFWFWATNVHNKPGISAGQFGVSIRAINGAIECDQLQNWSYAKKRYQYYVNCFSACQLSNPIENGCYN